MIPQSASTDAYAFLLGRIDYERAATIHYGEREFKLDRMYDLLSRLGHPQRSLPAIHITGTKGKGSTAAMIAAALIAAGYRTGVFSSPHLHHIEERLAVNGQSCPPAEFVALLDRLRPIVAEMDTLAASATPSETGPTYFEIATALAWLHFVERQVDMVVLEVGLGGRLDSTNICAPLASVITSISFDHTRQLGNTLAAIAREKAGIIKSGVPVVSGVLDPEPREVIRGVARDHGCRLVELGQDFFVDYQPGVVDGRLSRRSRIDFDARAAGAGRTRRGLELGLAGRHQAANAAVAVAVLDELLRQGWRIPESAIRQGLAAASIPARIECLQHHPTLIVDGAHNVASIEALLATLDESFRAGRHILVFATTKDKDARGMLARLLPRFDQVIFTRYQSNPRGVPCEELEEIAGREARHCRSAADAAAAWDMLRGKLEPDDLVCVTGSFYIAAEMRQEILSRPDCEVPRTS